MAVLDGFLIGERWQAQELYHCLAAYLERGETAETLDEDDEALGGKWLTINQRSGVGRA